MGPCYRYRRNGRSAIVDGRTTEGAVMSTQPEQAKAEILQQIVATIHEKVPEDRRDQVEEFARQYYQRLAPEDLLELEPEDLYGAVLAHWRLAHRRQPGEAKVRVYSPRFEEHGWRSRHSIVEIVTDDMPFLVDSVAMELNRHGLVIHLPIHPVIVVRRDEAGGLVEVLPPTPATASASPTCTSRSTARASRRCWTGCGPRSSGSWRTSRPPPRTGPRCASRSARSWRSSTSTRPGRRGRAGRGQGAAGVDRRPPLHLPRLPLLRPGHRGRRGHAAPGARHRPRHPAPGPGQAGLGQLRQAAAGGQAPGPRAARAHPDQGELALDRAPAVVPGLHRGQALRRAGRGRRRAALPRPVHLGRLQPEPARHPGAAPQGDQGAGAGRLPATATTGSRC